LDQQWDAVGYRTIIIVYKLNARWIVDSAIDLLWRNILSPEFAAKFQRKVSLFVELPEFPYTIERLLSLS